MQTVSRALNSVGKQCFVKYYDRFQICTDKQALAEALLRDNPRASSLSAQLTRIRAAQWIFENGLEREALDLVLQSARIDAQTAEKARRLRESIRAEAWAPFVQSAVVFGRCRPIEDREEAMAHLRRFAMKYFPDEATVEAEIAAYGAAAQVYVIEIEHLSGKEVQEK